MSAGGRVHVRLQRALKLQDSLSAPQEKQKEVEEDEEEDAEKEGGIATASIG